MIGIIFATRQEAEPFLSSIRVFSFCKNPFLMFKSADERIVPCIIAISGIGKVASATVTTELIIEHGVNFVINAGICGALKEGMSIGELYRISRAVEGDRACFKQNILEMFECTCFFKDISSAILVSADKSIFDNELKSEISLIGDLADMEGAAIVRVASMYGIGCDILKGVSDLANNSGASNMRLNLERVSVTISRVILKSIKNLKNVDIFDL